MLCRCVACHARARFRCAYIADGHHRAASAVVRRAAHATKRSAAGTYTGKGAVQLRPRPSCSRASQLTILPYNRVGFRSQRTRYVQLLSA
ncbi:MAG: DUF1015 family protein [Collinsella sp.]